MSVSEVLQKTLESDNGGHEGICNGVRNRELGVWLEYLERGRVGGEESCSLSQGELEEGRVEGGE